MGGLRELRRAAHDLEERFSAGSLLLVTDRLAGKVRAVGNLDVVVGAIVIASA